MQTHLLIVLLSCIVHQLGAARALGALLRGRLLLLFLLLIFVIVIAALEVLIVVVVL